MVNCNVMDFISASPVLVLGVTVVLAWILDSRFLKLCAALVFFLYPVLIGKVNFDFKLIYISNIFKFWFTQALQTLLEYIRQNLV